jgi:hypothetical protein
VSANVMRFEFVLVGCILVVLGVILSSVGYDKIQPTAVERVVTFVEKISGQNAPDSLHSSKTGGYLLLLFGGVSAIAGLGMILRSRTAPEERQDAETDRSREVQTPDAGSSGEKSATH